MSKRRSTRGGALTGAQIKLASEGESAYRDATIDGNLIIGQAGSAEEDLQITAAWDGVSTTQTAQVRVRQGLGERFYDIIDDLLDPTDGAIGHAQGRCDSAVDRIEDYIEREELRLERLEERLTLKFARLEQSLMLLETQQAALGMI